MRLKAMIVLLQVALLIVIAGAGWRVERRYRQAINENAAIQLEARSQITSTENLIKNHLEVLLSVVEAETGLIPELEVLRELRGGIEQGGLTEEILGRTLQAYHELSLQAVAQVGRDQVLKYSLMRLPLLEDELSHNEQAIVVLRRELEATERALAEANADRNRTGRELASRSAKLEQEKARSAGLNAVRIEARRAIGALASKPEGEVIREELGRIIEVLEE